MKQIQSTTGFTIGSIVLQRVSFEVLDAVGDRKAEAEGKKRIETSYDTRLIAQKEGSLTIELLLHVEGFAGDVKVWAGDTQHRGDFVVDMSCQIPVDQIVKHYAPAYLYAFGRELIADMARRSMRLLVLPPAVFAPSSPAKH